jgi:Fur family ferric uptake transcriptional regulator
MWQRLIITFVLLEAEDHPDVVQIQLRTLEKDARESHAAAYQTLSILTAKGLLHSHTFEGEATRFELANRLLHNHLIDVETRQRKNGCVSGVGISYQKS